VDRWLIPLVIVACSALGQHWGWRMAWITVFVVVVSFSLQAVRGQFSMKWWQCAVVVLLVALPFVMGW
jgi:hypothetical protein